VDGIGAIIMSKKTIRAVELSDIRELDFVTLSDHMVICFKVLGRDEEGLIIDAEPFRVKLSDVVRATGYRTREARLVGTPVLWDEGESSYETEEG